MKAPGKQTAPELSDVLDNLDISEKAAALRWPLQQAPGPSSNLTCIYKYGNIHKIININTSGKICLFKGHGGNDSG